ncbi:winged helix-turn-helix transcriptional regulator [Candidatus Woesearchaeota archaeon]|nr:winged helix-turn-helix transcriptional regulator [Candidatus Woesearchaeota archaeon]
MNVNANQGIKCFQRGFSVDISDTDSKIMNILLENSRLSYRQIAKKAGVSVVTVMNRVKNLEKSGIIRGYSVSLDYEKLGYDIVALIDIKISKGKLAMMEKRIASNENVIACYDMTGEFDAQIITRFRNRRGLDAFLKKIQTYEFVERTRTNLVLNTVKEQQNKLS